MKLWLLNPLESPHRTSPWDPWYDKAFAFVVRAETEGEARLMADENSGDESREVAGIRPWLSGQYSTCEELGADGKAEIVCRDFAKA